MRAEQSIQFPLINGESVNYRIDDQSLARFLSRLQKASEDSAVGESTMIELIYGAENPLMDGSLTVGRGMVTKRTLDHPLYRVMVDFLDRKRIQLGTLDVSALEAAYTVTVADAANILGIHASAIRQAIQAGRLSTWKNGEKYYLRPESLESYDVGQQGPRSDKRSGGAVLRIRCGHSKGILFGIRIGESMNSDEHGNIAPGEFERHFIDVDERLDRQRLMAESHPAPGVVEGLLPSGWLKIGILTNSKGHTGQRFFVLEPSDARERFEFAGFFVAGKFRVVERINNPRQAIQASKAFHAEWL